MTGRRDHFWCRRCFVSAQRRIGTTLAHTMLATEHLPNGNLWQPSLPRLRTKQRLRVAEQVVHATLPLRAPRPQLKSAAALACHDMNASSVILPLCTCPPDFAFPGFRVKLRNALNADVLEAVLDACWPNNEQG
eukprot:scaffold1376_cov257-Pinguiococcus_pyrenoidosus.AAC.16